MAEQATGRGFRSGPGNKRIATTFLESLAVRGQAAPRTRAMRALGLGEAGLAEAAAWLPDEDAIRRMFAAADTDPAQARSVGHRLIAPDATGLALYGLGLATPEKAYRRIQALFPRERVGSRWSVDEIAPGSARIAYHAPPSEAEVDRISKAGRATAGAHRGETSLCALRIGMLEVVPGLFGLLPARVTEISCLARGADACRYEIRWERNSIHGALIGGGVGLALAVGSVGVALALGPAGFPLPIALFLATTSLALAVALGRTVDLTRQLEAVAGARRGHLALFDQVDDALASKLDALARVEAKLESEESATRSIRSSVDPVDLVALVTRAVSVARPILPAGTIVHFDHDPDRISIVCEPLQIEQVVVQLLRNAAEASRGLTETPEVFVSLRQMSGGIELAVEDRGVGIEPSELDEIFDPFFGDRRAGVDEGFGLPICLRIVERHGGELRIEAEDRPGTRVSVFLPESLEAGR